jgi:hypothetical protein
MIRCSYKLWVGVVNESNIQSKTLWKVIHTRDNILEQYETPMVCMVTSSRESTFTPESSVCFTVSKSENYRRFGGICCLFL